MTTVTFTPESTAVSRAGRPLWPKVESPMTATEGVLPRQGGAHGHADAGAHLHYGVDGGHGLLGGQGVAADVAEHAGFRGPDLDEGLLQGLIGVHMAAAITEAGRTDRQLEAGGGFSDRGFHAEGVLQ